MRKTKVMNECFAPNRAVGPWRAQGAGIEREMGLSLYWMLVRQRAC